MQCLQTSSVSVYQLDVKLRTCANQTAGVLAGGMPHRKAAAWLITVMPAMPPCRPAPKLPYADCHALCSNPAMLQLRGKAACNVFVFLCKHVLP